MEDKLRKHFLECHIGMPRLLPGMFYKSFLLMLLVTSVARAGDSGREDFRHWPARNFNDMKKSGEAFCIYIKDTTEKNNKAFAAFESKDILDHDAIAKSLKGFLCSKLAVTDKAAPSYPHEWILRSKSQAVLILASSDLARTAVFDNANKNAPAIAAAADMILKYQKDRKVEALTKAKKDEEIRKAKFAEEVKKNSAGNIPGMEAKAAPKKDKKNAVKAIEEE